MAETLTFRAHPDLLAAVDQAADDLDTSVSGLVRDAVTEYLEARGYDRPKSYPSAHRRNAAAKAASA
jgi:predicted transcriptional regulator